MFGRRNKPPSLTAKEHYAAMKSIYEKQMLERMRTGARIRRTVKVDDIHSDKVAERYEENVRSEHRKLYEKSFGHRISLPATLNNSLNISNISTTSDTSAQLPTGLLPLSPQKPAAAPSISGPSLPTQLPTTSVVHAPPSPAASSFAFAPESSSTPRRPQLTRQEAGILLHKHPVTKDEGPAVTSTPVVAKTLPQQLAAPKPAMNFNFGQPTVSSPPKIEVIASTPSPKPTQSLFAPKPAEVKPAPVDLKPVFTPPQPIIAPQPRPISPIRSEESVPLNVRQRRPSKSETPPSARYSHWVNKTLEHYDESNAKVLALKKDPELAPICVRIRMDVQEIIDVYLRDDPKDVKSISQALNLFHDLMTLRKSKNCENALPDTPDSKTFILMCICERYLKRVLSDEGCIETVAYLFTALIRKEPDLFNTIVSVVFHNCILPRLNMEQCLTKALELSESAEEASQWVVAESAQCRLLMRLCAIVPPDTTDGGFHGMNLLRFLLNEALKAPAIPLACPFVVTLILQIAATVRRKQFLTDFGPFVAKAHQLCCESDWPTILHSAVIGLPPEIKFTDRAQLVLTTRNSAALQQLKSTLDSMPK